MSNFLDSFIIEDERRPDDKIAHDASLKQMKAKGMLVLFFDPKSVVYKEFLYLQSVLLGKLVFSKYEENGSLALLVREFRWSTTFQRCPKLYSLDLTPAGFFFPKLTPSFWQFWGYPNLHDDRSVWICTEKSAEWIKKTSSCGLKLRLFLTWFATFLNLNRD